MLDALSHLALEVRYLDRAREFYEERLGLRPETETEGAVAYRAGEADLVLRRPSTVPRGALHLHYAMSTPRDAFGAWEERLADLDPEVAEFGSYRSLYVDDPDGHCVELGNNGEAGAGDPGGVFEVVLEVESLERAEETYRTLGFEPVDRGTERRRVRLRGPFDLELWEPQLGIADARGGVHVDLGLRAPDPAAAADAIAERVDSRTAVEDGVRVRDEDGHYLTFRSE